MQQDDSDDEAVSPHSSGSPRIAAGNQQDSSNLSEEDVQQIPSEDTDGAVLEASSVHASRLLAEDDCDAKQDDPLRWSAGEERVMSCKPAGVMQAGPSLLAVRQTAG